jgi:hypothetical protein
MVTWPYQELLYNTEKHSNQRSVDYALKNLRITQLSVLCAHTGVGLAHTGCRSCTYRVSVLHIQGVGLAHTTSFHRHVPIYSSGQFENFQVERGTEVCLFVGCCKIVLNTGKNKQPFNSGIAAIHGDIAAGSNNNVKTKRNNECVQSK